MIEIRVGQLAQQLGVHRNTITNWIRKGLLKATPTVGKRYLVEKVDFKHFCQTVGIPLATMETMLPSHPGNDIKAPQQPLSGLEMP